MVNLHIAWKVQTNHLEFCYLILLEGTKIYNLDLLHFFFNFSFCFLVADDKLFFLFVIFLRRIWEKTYLHMDMILLNVLLTVSF